MFISVFKDKDAPTMNEEKKEEIWLSLITKTPSPTEKSKKQRENTKTPP